jgi:signal transduction histidine kinase
MVAGRDAVRRVAARRLSGLVLIAGLVWAGAAMRAQLAVQQRWVVLAPEMAAGIALLLAGLGIRSHRRDNRCWWLLVAASFAWFVGDFQHVSAQGVATAAFVFAGYQVLLLSWAVLAYPTGSLRRRSSMSAVAVIGALLVARTGARLFLHVPPDVAGYGTTNRFLPISDDRWWRAVERIVDVGLALTSVAVLLLLTSRWLRSSGAGRRMVAPVVAAAALLTISVVVSTRSGWNAGFPGGGRHVPNAAVVNWAHVGVALAFVAGIAQLRRSRAAIVDLVADVGDGPEPRRLADALAKVFRDDNIVLLTWSPAHNGYVDSGGQMVQVPSCGPDEVVSRIDRAGQPLALMIHDVALLEDPGLVDAITATVRLTVDNHRLERDLEAQVAELEQSQLRIVEAGDVERRRLERDLHDGAQQRLVTIALSLKLAEERLDAEADPDIRAVLTQSVKDLGEAINELRDLARGVHPAILTDSGLVAALESLVDRTSIRVDADFDVAHEPSPAIASAAYFAVSEGLANVGKHAHASTVTVRATDRAGTLRLTLTDDGVGGIDLAAGSGLRGIADRVRALGGTLTASSNPNGSGSSIEITLPCTS